MEFNNDVFQVLVPESLNATDATNIDSIVANQLALVNAETNDMVVPAVVADIPSKYYFAVKYPEGIAKSAGQYIEAKNVVAISAKKGEAATMQTTHVSFGNVTATADEVNNGMMDTEYGIRLAYQNARIHRLIGMTPFTKSYLVSGYHFTSQNVADIPVEKKAAILAGLMKQINAEPDKMVIASIDGEVGGVYTPYAFTTVEQLRDDMITNSTTNYVLTLVGNMIDEYEFSDINMHYYKDRVTTFSVYPVCGFDSTFALATTAAKPSVGDGYDVRQREYRAGGWNGKPGPYRASELLGLARSGFHYHADSNAMYDIVSITYKKNNVSGWLDHTSICTTEIAIPHSEYVYVNTMMQLIADAAGISYTAIIA